MVFLTFRFCHFFKRDLLGGLWKVCFDFERTGRIFDFDKTFLCFQNYQIWPFLWRNQLSLLRHRYFYPMGMPLREVESQTHYTGNDSISCWWAVKSAVWLCTRWYNSGRASWNVSSCIAGSHTLNRRSWLKVYDPQTEKIGSFSKKCTICLIIRFSDF